MIFIYIALFFAVFIVGYRTFGYFISLRNRFRISRFDMWRGRVFFGFICGALAVYLLAEIMNGWISEPAGWPYCENAGRV